MDGGDSLKPSYWRYVKALVIRTIERTRNVHRTANLVINVLTFFVALILAGVYRSIAEATLQTTGIAFFTVWLTVFLLFVGPYELWAEATSKLDAFKPRLRLSIRSASKLLYGTTIEAPFGKAFYTQLSDNLKCVRVLCSNTGETPVHNCQAFLIAIMEVEEDGEKIDIGFNEHVDLSWSRDKNKPDFQVTIPQKRERFIYLLSIRPTHVSLFRNPNEIPLEYRHLFAANRTYHLDIQVSGEGCASVYLGLRIRIGDTLDDIDVKEILPDP